MPLTALLDGTQVIDTTWCSSATWRSIHRVDPPADLTCRECGNPMSAKMSRNGLRFFAHKKFHPCRYRGETTEDMTLRARIARMIRELGGIAEVEAQPKANDEGDWRPDILGIDKNLKRVAFEIQSTSLTPEEGWKRTREYERDEILVVWMSAKHSSWMNAIPSMHVVRGDKSSLLVDRGLARLSRVTLQGRDGYRWVNAKPVELKRVIKALLEGELSYHETTLTKQRTGDTTRKIQHPIHFITSKDKATLQRIEELSSASVEEIVDYGHYPTPTHSHDVHTIPVMCKQESLLSQAINDILAEGIESRFIWLGSEQVWLLRHEADETRGCLLDEEGMLGDVKTGFGLPVSVGSASDKAEIRAIVSPLPKYSHPGMGASWSVRNVRVYAASPKEATTIARTLGWKSNSINVPRTGAVESGETELLDGEG